MTEETRQAHRCWRYRMKDGEMESRIFDHPDDAPAEDGWVDSPARVMEVPSVGAVPDPASTSPVPDVPPVPPVGAPVPAEQPDGAPVPAAPDATPDAPETAPAAVPNSDPEKPAPKKKGNDILSSKKTAK